MDSTNLDWIQSSKRKDDVREILSKGSVARVTEVAQENWNL